MAPQLHSLHQAGVASLGGWTVFHLTVPDIIPPPDAGGITPAIRANTQRTEEVDGGGGGEYREEGTHTDTHQKLLLLV